MSSLSLGKLRFEIAGTEGWTGKGVTWTSVCRNFRASATNQVSIFQGLHEERSFWTVSVKKRCITGKKCNILILKSTRKFYCKPLSSNSANVFRPELLTFICECWVVHVCSVLLESLEAPSLSSFKSSIFPMELVNNFGVFKWNRFWERVYVRRFPSIWKFCE